MADVNYNFPVVILCGGQGTRLRERTESIPKPLVEVGGMPILWHILKIFSTAGFKRFILCLGYKGEKIREFFVHLTEWPSRDFTLRLKHVDERRIEYHEKGVEDWTITFVDTGAETETGGRLKQIEPYVQASTFFMTYGDGVSDLSIEALLETHRKQKRVGTMTCVRPRTHFGIVKIGVDESVNVYEEKPVLNTYVNGGFFCLDRDVFRYIDENDVFERGPMQRLITANQLAAHVHEGFWACMDTYKDHLVLNDMWKSKQAPWKTW